MSEPRASADRTVEIVPGLRHWSILDERIEFRSDAYALETPDGAVAIDPVPLDQPLGPVAAIVIGGAFHQRSAWSLRRASGAPVLAPRAAAPLDASPDRLFDDGDALPGGLVAATLIGPRAPHAAFTLELAGRRILFCGDLAMRGDDGPFALVPPEHREDPAGLRRSVERLAAERWDVLCPAHGAPLVGDGRAALEAALRAG